MIKFFRKIRQQLLVKGAVKKYLLYAIGEILLVVIGILIALQINNWNEARKNRKEEQKILIGLQQEFKLNERQFKNVLSIHNRVLQAQLHWLQIMEGEREVPNNIALDTLFTLSAENWTFNPVKGVINSLITSGKIDLIRNDSLKFHLTNWNDIVDDYREDELALRKFSMEIMTPFLLDKVPFNEQTIAHMDKYEAASKIDYKPLLTSLKYRNILKVRTAWINEILREGKDIEHILNNIIRHLSES